MNATSKTTLAPILASCAAALLSAAAAAELPNLKYDDAGAATDATGFFRVERGGDGAWRFATPGGHGFFLAANNGPSRMDGDYCPALGHSPYRRTLEAKYGRDRARWAADAKSRLLSWNFNAVAVWDRPAKGLAGDGLAYVRVLQLGKSFAGSAPNSPSNLLDNAAHKGRFPNVFHPDFAAHCRRVAAKTCAKASGDPWLVGWFTDNEISWRGARRQDANANAEDARDGTGMFDAVAALPPDHPGRAALDRFLAERGVASPAEADAGAKRGFMRLVASEYYRIAVTAVREADPNHAVLGCRFAGFRSTPDAAWEEGGKWNDAMSVNVYPPADLTNHVVRAGFWDARPLAEKINEVCALSKKPLILSEWAYPALDTPCPCKTGAGQRVPTQKERAAASALFAETAIAHPWVVGYAHFRWVDEPPLGRWKKEGGEDCNYGLVDLDDNPYALLTDALRDVQGRMYETRRSATLPAPTLNSKLSTPN